MPTIDVVTAGTSAAYYRARYYEPNSGRFISEDPSRLVGGINFYNYVFGNPVVQADPMGLAPPCLNIQNFVAFMNQQAAGVTKSKGDCAQSVKRGLRAGGLSVAGLHNGPHNYGTGLEHLGFVPMNNNSKFEPGDVMIFQPPNGKANGHIQMWNGTQWVSDFMQPNMKDGYPGPGSTYEKANPAYQLYRDPNICSPANGGKAGESHENANWLQQVIQ